MTQSRPSDRQRMFVEGRLSFGGGALSANCYVRDLSSVGARLKVDPGAVLPGLVTLQIPSRNVLREAEVRWRHGDVVDLEFVKAAEPVDADPVDLPRRVRELEEENASLRQKIRELRLELANRLARDDASN